MKVNTIISQLKVRLTNLVSLWIIECIDDTGWREFQAPLRPIIDFPCGGNLLKTRKSESVYVIKEVAIL